MKKKDKTAHTTEEAIGQQPDLPETEPGCYLGYQCSSFAAGLPVKLRYP